MTQPGAHAARVAVLHNASTRLGRALAKELALQGFSLALCSTKPADLESVVDETFNLVEVSPFKVSAYECDPRDKRSVYMCAKEILEDFSRVDVVCILENRPDEYDAELDDMSEIIPVLSSDGEAFHSFNVDASDIRYLLDAFYPLLKRAKPLAPPLRFFENIPAGARRVLKPDDGENGDETSDDEEEDGTATSLLLYLTTADGVFCRAGRSATSARVRTIEALLVGLNAEAVARNEAVRACTAIVGTLDGEIPFWRFDQARFLHEARAEEEKWADRKRQREADSKHIVARSVRFTEEPAAAKKENRTGSFEVIHSLIPARLLRSRRASRSRGPAENESKSGASVVEVSDEEDDADEDETKSVVSARETEGSARPEGVLEEEVDDEDDDMIPPPSPVHRRFNHEPERLTSESLSHAEACAWITWGLSRGRHRIIVGYDLLLLRSAWVPNVVLRALFSFNSRGSPNLLPIRTKETYLPTTQTARRAQARYDATRRRRQQARELVVLVLFVFALFPPGLALGLLFLVFVWHRVSNSSEGHTATERAVAVVLFLIALRRRWFIKVAWDGFRSFERTLFGALSSFAKDLNTRFEDRWRRGNKARRQSTRVA